jgi:uncharacterized delta-60 repeat protein
MRRVLLALAALAALPAAAPADPRLTAAPGRVTVTYDASRPLLERFDSVALAPGGALYAAGPTGRTQRLAITALRADGGLDRTFGDGGGVIVPRDVREGDALLRAADGTLTAVGRRPAGDGSSLGPPAAVRLRAGGCLVAGYGGDGVADVPGIAQIGCPTCRSTALLPDGGLVVAGSGGRAPGFRFTVARLRPDGSPDPGFGSGGVARPLPGPGSATAVVVQPGRIVVLGTAGADDASVLVGLRPDGSLDPAFGVVELPGSSHQLAQDAAGRLLVLVVDPQPEVLRLTPGGALDASWGSGGRAPLAEQLIGTLFPTATGVTVVAGRSGGLIQVHLNALGRIVGRHTTRVPFGGGSFPSGGFGPLGRQSFFGHGAALRPDGSLVAGSSVAITQGDDGDTIDHSEAALAFVGPDGELAPTVTTGRPRLRGALRNDRLRAVRRRGALRVVLRPGRRGLAQVRARARGRLVARGMVPLWAARRTVARVPLTRAGRRLLRRTPRSLRIAVEIRANDMAGNRTAVAVRRRLRGR